MGWKSEEMQISEL